VATAAMTVPASQRRRDAETLAHAEGVAPERPAGGRAEPDKLQHLIRPRQRDARGLADDAQVIAPGPVPMRRARLKDRADAADRLIQVGIADAADGGRSRGRLDQIEQHPQRRRLPRTVRAEEPGHPARFHRERQVIDGPDAAVFLAQPADLDPSLGQQRGRDPRSAERPVRKPRPGAVRARAVRARTVAIKPHQPHQAAHHDDRDHDNHLTPPAATAFAASWGPG